MPTRSPRVALPLVPLEEGLGLQGVKHRIQGGIGVLVDRIETCGDFPLILTFEVATDRFRVETTSRHARVLGRPLGSVEHVVGNRHRGFHGGRREYNSGHTKNPTAHQNAPLSLKLVHPRPATMTWS